jgi:hypothetical protein
VSPSEMHKEAMKKLSQALSLAQEAVDLLAGTPVQEKLSIRTAVKRVLSQKGPRHVADLASDVQALGVEFDSEDPNYPRRAVASICSTRTNEFKRIKPGTYALA